MPRPNVIRRPSVALLLAPVLLAACQMVAIAPLQKPALMLDGALSVSGPRGYCVDPRATQQGDDTAVVLMGRCRYALAVAPAVLTVSVGPAGSAGVLAAGGPALTTFFTSEAGRSALSRSGDAGDLAVIEALSVGPAYLLQLNDRAIGAYWRAVIGVKGRLVTISANGTPPEPLALAGGRKLVDATLTALLRAN